MDWDTALAFVKQYREEIMVVATVALAAATWGLVIAANLNAQREMRAYIGIQEWQHPSRHCRPEACPGNLLQ